MLWITLPFVFVTKYRRKCVSFHLNFYTFLRNMIQSLCRYKIAKIHLS
jgi:REP element-mobilizing transposase RayT